MDKTLDELLDDKQNLTKALDADMLSIDEYRDAINEIDSVIHLMYNRMYGDEEE